MDRLPYTVAVAHGQGLVARSANVVMYIADASLSAGPLVTAAESVADAQQPGRALGERLAALTFGTDSASVPAFGVLAPTADGLLLLLRGAVVATRSTLLGDAIAPPLPNSLVRCVNPRHGA